MKKKMNDYIVEKGEQLTRLSNLKKEERMEPPQ